MALPPLPPENTDRWWIIYSNNSVEHRTMVRTLVGLTAATMSVNFNNLFTALSGSLNNTIILGMEKANKGSNVRNPQVYSGGSNFGSGTEVDTDGRARVWSFVGRSTNGRKSRLFIFGAKPYSEGDYRINISEDANVAAAVTALNTPAAAFLSIDELKPVWRNYANIGYSDHWIKQFRRG